MRAPRAPGGAPQMSKSHSRDEETGRRDKLLQAPTQIIELPCQGSEAVPLVASSCIEESDQTGLLGEQAHLPGDSLLTTLQRCGKGYLQRPDSAATPRGCQARSKECPPWSDNHTPGRRAYSYDAKGATRKAQCMHVWHPTLHGLGCAWTLPVDAFRLYNYGLSVPELSSQQQA